MPKLTYQELLRKDLSTLRRFDLRKHYRRKEIEEGILTIMENLDNINNPKYISYGEALCEYFTKLYNSRMLWPLIENAAKQDIIVPTSNLAFDISKKDLESLVYYFFKDATDKETFKIFMHFWHQRKESIYYKRSEESGGLASFIPFFNQGIIFLNRTSTFLDAFNFVHEYGHLIHFYKNYSTYSIYLLKPLTEISSLFFQMVSAEYFSNIKGLETLSTFTQAEYLNISLESSRELVQEFHQFNGIENERQLKSALDNLINLLSSEKLEMLFTDREDYSDDYMYNASLCIASNLFMIYLNDPQEAFNILNKFHLIDLKLSLSEYYNQICKLGLGNISGIKLYTEHMKRKLERL